jgi:signal transduction histidine kinase
MLFVCDSASKRGSVRAAAGVSRLREMDLIAATDEGTDILVRRLRVGLAIIIGGVLAFLIVDLEVHPPNGDLLVLIQSIELVAMVVAIVALGLRLPRRTVIAIALCTTGGLAASTAVSGVLSGDASSTILLLALLMMGTGTLLPWGAWPQLVLQCVAGAGIVWNVWAVDGPDMALRSLLVGAVVGFAGALYAAHTLEQQRRDRARAEAALEEARTRRHHAELEHAARLSILGEMAAGLAHEINQPLSAIVSYATGCMVRIESGGADVEAIGKIVREMSDEALRAGEVLRRMREFARNGARHLERVDPDDLVRSAMRLASNDARRLEIPVRLDLAAGGRLVEVDRVQLEQVILNLVRNAFEAMDGQQRGEHTLRIETTSTPAGVVEVAVGDSGGGLPDEVRGRVFDPFFTTKRDGLGLGLAISRRIVEAHGGRLWSTPNRERGTTFRFSLPATLEPTPDVA